MPGFGGAARRIVGAAAFADLKRRFPTGYVDPVYGLTAEEMMALAIYTSISGHHLRINRSLWERRKDSPARMVSRALAGALGKLPRHPGLCFRSVDPAGGPEQARKDYAVGSTVSWPAFTSTSVNIADCPARSVLFVIRSETGRILRYVSEMPDEREVLFAPATAFDILGQAEAGGRLIVEMAEV
ncbi:ADP-ribosyltransferase domain-containing protein [Xanthobacter pseudotagetidis]|uniref:ADP-ribosyltransferase domain-containing protein n=1 Tax=Xanthobacter pseudotagetidis TaxID=3119911 RepID=UPI00372858C4